jgi:hypothetical protein
MGTGKRDMSAAAIPEARDGLRSTAVVPRGLGSLEEIEQLLEGTPDDNIDARDAVNGMVTLSRIQGKERIVFGRRIETAMLSCAKVVAQHTSRLSVKEITQALRASGGVFLFQLHAFILYATLRFSAGMPLKS